MPSQFPFVHSYGTDALFASSGIGEKERSMMTTLRRREDVQASRDGQPSAPASPSRASGWKVLVIKGKICYHRGMKWAE